MTQDELKSKIAKTEQAIADETNAEDKAIMESFLAKLKRQLEEQKYPKKEDTNAPAKKTAKKRGRPKTSKTEIQKKEEPVPGVKPVKKQIKIVKKAIETQVPPKPERKILVIKKDKKKEEHPIDTTFGKDIKGAIVELNKGRFVLREVHNKKTGQKETVHHTQEYRNAKTIKTRVDNIFNSSVFDIAKTYKEKQEKKEIISLVNEIRDLHILWINELDMIITNEDMKSLEAIKKLMHGLIKEAMKNDGDDKWTKAMGLADLAKKYNLT